MKNSPSSFSLLEGLASSKPSVSQPSSGSSSSISLLPLADTEYELLTASSTDLSPTRPSTNLPSSSKSSNGSADSDEAFFAELELEIKNKKLPKKRLKKQLPKQPTLEDRKKKRLKHLANAVQSVNDFKEPSIEPYEDFWSVTSPIFDGSKAGSAPEAPKVLKGDFEAAVWRLGKLEKARKKILSNDELTPRLWLVFHAH